jgi:hypothetical protein
VIALPIFWRRCWKTFRQAAEQARLCDERAAVKDQVTE